MEMEKNVQKKKSYGNGKNIQKKNIANKIAMIVNENEITQNYDNCLNSRF